MALARLLLETVVVLCFVDSWSCVSSAALLAAVALAAVAAAQVLVVALSALALLAAGVRVSLVSSLVVMVEVA